MKRLALVLAFGSITAFAGAQSAKVHKLNGWINDSKCGASHIDAACAKKCIAGGATPVFVDSHKKVWTVDNADAVQDYLGEKVKVSATEDSANNSIHVNKIAKSGVMSSM